MTDYAKIVEDIIEKKGQRKMENSNTRTNASRGGVGCLTILGLIFVALKLAEVGQVAKWSWWWVLAPFWIQPVLVLLILAVVLVIAACVSD